MSSNDLLSYSIMHSGDRVASAYLNTRNLNHSHHLPLPLPLPLKSIPINNNCNHDDLPITLPPINGKYIHTLTENNLTHFATTTLAHHNLLPSKAPSSSSPPSLTSSTSSTTSVSPVSSPDLPAVNLHQASVAKEYISQPKRRQRLGPSCDSCRSRKVKCNAEIVVLSRFFDESKDLESYKLSADQTEELVSSKRSIKLNEEFNLIVSNSKLIKFKPCESCKSKSITCCFSKGYTKEDIMSNNKKSTPPTPSATATNTTTATSSVSSESEDSGPSPVKVESRKYKSLSLMINPASTINTNHKISKPKKDVSITNNSTVLANILSPKKPSSSEFNPRKSSCGSCRRRKVKCVFNAALNKCEGCVKKGHDCSFETK